MEFRQGLNGVNGRNVNQRDAYRFDGYLKRIVSVLIGLVTLGNYFLVPC